MTASGPSILLVDDDPDLLRLLTMRLGAAGYRVQTAASGEEALSRIRVERPQAVVTDMRMDGMDGMALFGRIHETDPALPVIMLTAHGSIPDAVEATQRGLFGYLAKPCDAQDLIALLRRAVELHQGEGASQEASQAWRAGVVTTSPAMEVLLSEAHLVAQSDASVLIQGESGTGKEVLAKAIHLASPRHERPFVAINCGAIPEPLLESELFGHAKGAFTGAVSANKGLFQSAEGGTVFLDEIGDMPLALQVKLLRVIQEREIRPVGSSQSVPVNVRLISATHRDLEAAIREGQFREDLYYRINVVALQLPPLRERREDISLLAQHFLRAMNEKHLRKVSGFTPEALAMMVAHDWPGNVRQLLNVVEQCCALSTTSLIPAGLVARALRDKQVEIMTYAEAKARFEHDYLLQILKICEGSVAEAARLAGRNRTEFYRLLQRHALSPALFKPKD